MTHETLLARCVEDFGAGRELPREALLAWHASTRSAKTFRLAARSTFAPQLSLSAAVEAHPAHRHRWYQILAEELEVQEWAEFLWENTGFPGFIPLLERLRETQFVGRARAAIERNLADEQVPCPHRDLMRRLMAAVRERAPRPLHLEVMPTNVQRTLVFYYGYACDPWYLVGSLFATEAVASHRIASMGRGLRRLGLTPHDLEFISIHFVCDEHHARDWLDEVIGPSVEASPTLRASIALGAADCLTSSAVYLDALCGRYDARSEPRASAR